MDTIRQRLRDAIADLTAAGVPDAAADARKLMRMALEAAPGFSETELDREMQIEQILTLQHFVARRAARMPLSRIRMQRSFWKHDFYINAAVLDPRPDTETLVEAALAEPFERVLDLGTGSGCILLSLLDERHGAIGTGTDISAEALAVARVNAVPLGLASRATFVQSDWFSGVTGRFDLIVSNPPYIPEADIEGLEPEVRDHDPRIALTPGGDGLDAYRAIAKGAGARLTPGGRLMVEIGPTQAEAVSGLFAAAGLQDLRVLPDLDRRDRVVACVNSGSTDQPGDA